MSWAYRVRLQKGRSGNSWWARILSFCMFYICIPQKLKACSIFSLSQLRRTMLSKEWPSILETEPYMMPCGPKVITATALPVWSHQTPHTDARGASRVWGTERQLQMGLLSQHLSFPSKSLPKMQRAISVTSLNVSITSLEGCIRPALGADLISSLG